MITSTESKRLWRYTELPALLAMLRNRELTLLSPTTWDDKNDRNFMEAFVRARKLKTCLAVCFSEAPETYHHWRVFAPGSSGVCIEFDKQQLLRSLPKKGFVHRRVDYKKSGQLIGASIDPEELPFTKRWAFRHEREYRIVFGSRKLKLLTRELPAAPTSLVRVIVNPWMPRSLFEATCETIKSIDGFRELPIRQSSVVDNEIWKAYANRYA